jgi:hypothetical protein
MFYCGQGDCQKVPVPAAIIAGCKNASLRSYRRVRAGQSRLLNDATAGQDHIRCRACDRLRGLSSEQMFGIDDSAASDCKSATSISGLACGTVIVVLPSAIRRRSPLLRSIDRGHYCAHAWDTPTMAQTVEASHPLQIKREWAGARTRQTGTRDGSRLATCEH